MQKMNLDQNLVLYTKVNSKWIIDLNVKHKTMQLLEENIDILPFDIHLRNPFFGHVSSSKGNKSKHKHLGPHQTKTLLHSEAHFQQNEKAAYLKGENIFKSLL